MRMLPEKVRRSKYGHSKGQITWALPPDRTYYTSQEPGTTVLLGRVDLVAEQAAADGDLVRLACYGRGR